MAEYSVLMRPQGLRPGAGAPTLPPMLRHCISEVLEMMPCGYVVVCVWKEREREAKVFVNF